MGGVYFSLVSFSNICRVYGLDGYLGSNLYKVL